MNASTTSAKQRTAEQVTKFNRLYEDAMKRIRELVLKKVDPDKDGLQRLIENFDEYLDPVTDLAIDRAREMATPDQYTDEEVESSYTYSPEYKGPRPIAEQIKKLTEIFGLDGKPAPEFANNLPEFPEGAEGWFAILSPTAEMKLAPQAANDADRFCQVTDLILGKIATSRSFKNWREGQIDSVHLRRHVRTTAALAKIAEIQKGDILIIAAQLGRRHRGKSVRRARVCFSGNEFGLDPVAMGSIALTHPERYVRFEELDTDCPGAEFAPGAGGGFSRAPYLFFYGDRLRFGARDVDLPDGLYGSASGFSPQYPCTSKS